MTEREMTDMQKLQNALQKIERMSPVWEVEHGSYVGTYDTLTYFKLRYKSYEGLCVSMDTTSSLPYSSESNTDVSEIHVSQADVIIYEKKFCANIFFPSDPMASCCAYLKDYIVKTAKTVLDAKAQSEQPVKDRFWND